MIFFQKNLRGLKCELNMCCSISSFGGFYAMDRRKQTENRDADTLDPPEARRNKFNRTES